jgi:hypothetical protein
MFKLIEWTSGLDLTEFYTEATKRKFVNNSSQSAMIDCFRNEKDWAVWILYYKDRAVGSVAAHSIDCIPNAYRICARTCVFSDLLPFDTVRTRNQIRTHQHITAQFFIPQCIEFAGMDKDLYITSHPSPVGTQRLVHTIYCPELVRTGVIDNSFVKHYRGHDQTFWHLNASEFLKQLNNNKWIQ